MSDQQKALILFAHGARDPRWATPFERLQKMTQEKMPEVRVELAYLELMLPNLNQLVDELVQNNITTITIVPIFLGQGGHVLRDFPLIVNGLREKYPTLVLRQVSAVGEDASVLNAMSEYCVNVA